MKRRRPLTKAELVARLPRGLRPKLRAGQVLDLAVAHNGNLDTIARGLADAEVLWQWVGGILTWSKVAELLDTGVPEIAEQLDLAHAVIERFRRTGKVGFSGAEYQLAKKGVIVMDMLAELVDQPTASAAADWSERQVATMAEQGAVTA